MLHPEYIDISGKKVSTTPVFRQYWRFAAERQNVFFRRLSGEASVPITDDEILQSYKFTNSYRASDRVSQYLIRNVIYKDDTLLDPENLFFRIILFKLFNKVETWRMLERELGDVSLSGYDYNQYDDLLTSAMNSGQKIYSAAYIMPSAGRVFGHKYKHQNHLRLIEYMLSERFPERIASAKSMREMFDILMSAPSIGPFLAYQFATDLNYSPLTNFSEMDFVVAGPGALDGISKCFHDGHRLDPVLVIKYMADSQKDWFSRLNISFPSLWGRPLQLIDCQNIFCEISKYARAAFPNVKGVSGRTRIKQKFSPSGNLPIPWYPPKWGINEQIDSGRTHRLVARSADAKAVQYTLL